MTHYEEREDGELVRVVERPCPDDRLRAVCQELVDQGQGSDHWEFDNAEWLWSWFQSLKAALEE